ncbi:MAG: aminotransferase class III-fold pyridoxal phosphate-dependent enzyme, partial [Deferribacterota bacterium]|nr:aminotransferase class III-fold pyridoxal phosphate-dependent enzyme [Deferribacterota bacterium]
MKKNKILKIDREHIWHPYDSITDKSKTYEVKKAYKSTIELSDGRKLIDGMSSWWSCIHGYNNKYINKALNKQINKFSHIMFGGFTHKPAAKLAINLKKILNKDFDTFFYCDSGSVAVEIAVKMAFQYHMGMGNYKKNKILSFERAYHGDTFMAMSLCDPINSMHSKFSNILPHNINSPAPKSRFNAKYEDDHIYTEKIVEENIDELAAIIIEPIVQGAGGMYFYNSEFLNNLKRICDKYGLLLIFDEIATGFGRTG